MSHHKRPRVATVAEQNSSSSVGAQEAPAIKHFQCVALQYVGASHCCVRFGLNGLPPSPRLVSASPLSLSASASLFDQCMSLKLVIQGYSLLRTMLSLCLSLSLPLSLSPCFSHPHIVRRKGESVAPANSHGDCSLVGLYHRRGSRSGTVGLCDKQRPHSLGVVDALSAYRVSPEDEMLDIGVLGDDIVAGP